VSPSRPMQDRISDEFESIEREMGLNEHLHTLRETRPWDEIELRAVASTLHTIYTGIERCLLIVLRSTTGAVPTGKNWHRDVLNQASERGIITAQLAAKLEGHLAFRHMYRHSYGFTLDAELMLPLVESLPEIVDEAKSQLTN